MIKDKTQETILINEDLYLENLNEYAKKNLYYINIPNAVGISTKYDNNKKLYIIYVNDESGNIEWSQTSDSFAKSIVNARKFYQALVLYYPYIEISKTISKKSKKLSSK